MSINNKCQIPNDKQYQKNKQDQNEKDNRTLNLNDQGKRYDLEERTYFYAKRVNGYVNKLARTIPNIENGKQLVRSAGSVGANYIEANEALSKKDFSMRVKISRKEAKESRYWLCLTDPDEADHREKSQLIEESTELIKILSAILLKCRSFTV